MDKMNEYYSHEDHWDHILVGCPKLCIKEFWNYRNVMVVIICASKIMEEVNKQLEEKKE